MNTKKLIFSIAALFFIINAQVVYTKESQDDNNNSQIATNSDQNDTFQNDDQYNEAMWKFIEETFQTVVDQTQKIEFCLQTIEQIINAGKIKFDNQKISKSQLLQEIKDIKAIMQSITQSYAKQISKSEAQIIGTCLNAVFIDYLLPVITNDITKINADEFNKSIEPKFIELAIKFDEIQNLQALDQLLLQTIDQNESNLKLLMEASDNIGLSSLNKLYRYLDTKPLPWYGKSTLATAQDVAFWGTVTALTYSTAIFTFTTKETIIPFLKDRKFPFQKEIGNYDITDSYKQQQDTKEKARIMAEDFGYGNYLDLQTRGIQQNPLILVALGGLTWLAKKPALELFESAKKSYNHGINYYLKGDVSPAKDSHIIPKTYFKDMIGGDHLEKLAQELTDYLKNPTRYERAGISPSTGYLLVGPSQTGKSFFAKALKTMVDEAFEGSNEEVKFWTVLADDLTRMSFDDIFYWARKNAPIIIFIDEIDMYGTRRDKNAKNTQDLLTAMNGIDTDPSKKVIVIAATNKPEELDFALKQKGRLGSVITFDFPTYECRKQYLEKQLDKKNIMLSLEMIDIIAQETDGHTYNMIDDIIKQSLQLATFQTRPVQESDFEITLDREIRKIKPNTTMSAQEKEIVAIYQAGQAAARHILSTEQQIVKITIDTVDKPLKSKEGFGIINEQKGQFHENHELLPQIRMKSTRLGFVFTMSKTNNHELSSDEEQEKELIALLSGGAALELLKGKTFTGFGKEDRAKVLEALEKKISQGTPITDEIRQQAIAAKDLLYIKAKNCLKGHTSFIKVIVDELLKNSTINTKQWLELAANYKI